MNKFLKWFKEHVKISFDGKGRLVIDILVGAFIALSCTLYFTSCKASFGAEKFRYNGCIGAGCFTEIVDSISK